MMTTRFLKKSHLVCSLHPIYIYTINVELPDMIWFVHLFSDLVQFFRSDNF